jgi:hypothetical protein
MKKSIREDIIELINKLFIYTDNQQWDNLLGEVLCSEVNFDMSSIGGASSLVKADAITTAWRDGFKGIDVVHHQAGNYLVTFADENNAKVYCYALATHYKNDATQGKIREFVGSYDIDVTLTKNGWRISSFKYNLKYVNGNTDLK